MKRKWEIQKVGSGFGFMKLRLCSVEGREFISLTEWFDTKEWKYDW